MRRLRCYCILIYQTNLYEHSNPIYVLVFHIRDHLNRNKHRSMYSNSVCQLAEASIVITHTSLQSTFDHKDLLHTYMIYSFIMKHGFKKKHIKNILYAKYKSRTMNQYTDCDWYKYCILKQKDVVTDDPILHFVIQTCIYKKKLNRKKAGVKSRKRGYAAEDRCVRLLHKDKDLTFSIIQHYLRLLHIDVQTQHRDNIYVLDIHTNKQIERDVRQKIAPDVFIVFDYLHKRYIIKLDVKYSKSQSTQLCSKTIYKFPSQYVDNLRLYTHYNNLKQRTWISHSDKHNIKESICLL